jgi:hypothetical protein
MMVICNGCGTSSDNEISRVLYGEDVCPVCSNQRAVDQTWRDERKRTDEELGRLRLRVCKLEDDLAHLGQLLSLMVADEDHGGGQQR